MPWNLPPQGITPAQAAAGFQVHGTGINPTLLQQQHPVADAVQQAIQAVVGILDQQRRDKIANQLLAVDNAPKATAVDGADYVATSKDGVAAQNARLGFPTQDSGITPDFGGVRAWLEKKATDKEVNDNFDRNLKNQLTQSEIDKNGRPPRDPAIPEWMAKIQYPELFPSTNPDDKAADNLREKIYGDVATKAAQYHLTPEDLTADDSDVQFVFQQSGQVASPADLQNPDNKPFIMATGKLGNNALQVPYEDYVKLRNEAGSIPAKSRSGTAPTSQPNNALPHPRTEEEVLRLAPGTQFVAPNGAIKVR